MSIKALPPETFRKFNSSLVITSPEVLVKELVENSIDAAATSIEVLISSNTIDRIQVRDNGTGINQDDFDVLGRHSHTSKLTSFSELLHKGGTTFGFRGEALSSANTFGSVTITTRTKADKLASTISLVPKLGGVAVCKPTSGVFGTTVAVTRLFKDVPVRKQQYTKCAPRTLSKIKETLLRIIMARPTLKIVFKILTNQTTTLSFTPSALPSSKDAVLQVLGRDLASDCFPVTFRDGSFLVEAFLPTRHARAANISGHGSFMAVDSRPLDPTRGTMRKIFQMFRTFVSKAVGDVRTPFIQFNLHTPPGSYDVNVDIGKMEVLFVNEPFVISLLECLFKQVYDTPELDSGDLDEIMLDTDEVVAESPILETPTSGKNQMSTLVSNGQFGTNTTTINSDFSSSDVPQSDASLPQVAMSSTPPTSILNTDTFSDVCSTKECPVFEIMDVQTSWEVNMVFVGDSDEVPPPLGSQQVEVQVIENPVTSSFSDQTNRPSSRPQLNSGINPWTLSQRRERTSPNAGGRTETPLASSPGPGHDLLDTVYQPNPDDGLPPLQPLDYPRGDLDVPRNQRDLSVVDDDIGQGQPDMRMTLPIRSTGHAPPQQIQASPHLQKRFSNTPESPSRQPGTQRSFTRLTIDPSRSTTQQTPPKNTRSATKNVEMSSPQSRSSPPNSSRALRQTQISFPSRKPGVAQEPVNGYGVHDSVGCPLQTGTSGPGVVLGKRQRDSFQEYEDDNLEQGASDCGAREGPSSSRGDSRERHSFMDEEDLDEDVCDALPAVSRRVLVPKGRQQDDSYARPVYPRQDVLPARDGISPVPRARARTRTRMISRDIRHLPLESVPVDQQTQSLVMEASVTVARVRAGHVMGARYDAYAQAGVEAETLSGMELSEIDLVELEDRVRRTLSAWRDEEKGREFSESLSLGGLKGKGK